VEHAVTFEGDVLGDCTHVVVSDCLHHRLGLPAQPAALATDPHRAQILKLWQRPPVLRAVSTEHLTAETTVVPPDQRSKLQPARVTRLHRLVRDPLHTSLLDL